MAGLSAKIVDAQVKTACIDFMYPQVVSICPTDDEEVKETINSKITQIVWALIPREKIDQNGCSTEVTGRYAITFNDKGILSLRIDAFILPIPAANGSTVLESLTVNLWAGQEYEFDQLFKPNSGYRRIISDIIKEQIRVHNIPMIADVPPITCNQGYYLTDKNLVVYFQESVFTPHYVGPPEFAIPYVMLKNIICPYGPIAIILMDPPAG